MTARPAICEDASSLFNLLTGYSAPPKWNSLIVAPLGLHEAVLGLINRETEHARAGRPAKIVAKMNSLVDPDVIEALYRASQAGVQITLLIRGICCLRPGVPRVSETIEVRALIDRFLEHGRIFWFANGGKDDVYIASADWMPRNFHRRVEVMVPLEDPVLRGRLQEILTITISDTAKSWRLQSDGSYARIQLKPGQAPVRCQERFMAMTRDKVKVADAATRPSTRFHLSATQPRIGYDGSTPEVRRSRRQRKT
jgi:polyphosphate kinase